MIAITRRAPGYIVVDVEADFAEMATIIGPEQCVAYALRLVRDAAPDVWEAVFFLTDGAGGFTVEFKVVNE